MSRLVIDSSITLSWCFEDEFDDLARKCLAALDDTSVRVPELWLVEIANTLRMAERKRRIPAAKVDRLISDLAALPIDVSPTPPGYAAGIVALCRAYDLTAYDAAYLELAIRDGAMLATRDDALSRAAKGAQVPLFKV